MHHYTLTAAESSAVARLEQHASPAHDLLLLLCGIGLGEHTGDDRDWPAADR